MSGMRDPNKWNYRGATEEGSKRQMRMPQGASRTQTSWHKMRMIPNSGVESGGGAVQVQGKQYKVHAQRNTTQRPDGALRRGSSTLQGRPRRARLWAPVRKP